MKKMRRLVEEVTAASVALTLLGAIIAGIFWLATDQSPWPALILAELFAFGWGLILLIATSPTLRR